MHFLGIIIGPDPDGQMARYDEGLEVEPHLDECWECCGEERYQPCSECDSTGKAMTTRNPDGRWDWYVVGGRWPGLLTLTTGAEHRADQSLAGNVDWDRTLAELGEHRTYFMVAEGAWKAKEEHVPDNPQGEWFVQDPNYQHLWDTMVRGLDPSVLVTIVDIHT